MEIMTLKRITGVLSLLASFSISAQTTMNIYQGNGTVLQIPLNSIDSITYTVGNPGNLATLTTLPIGNISVNSATSGGSISSDGGTPVTQRGVCWSLIPNPTTAYNLTVDGNGIGSFTSALSGLQPGVTYYVRAYAINSAGVAYGNQLQFITSGSGTGNLATLSTMPVQGITTSTAISGGNITDNGGLAVLYRGVCWSFNPNPTTADNATWNGEGMGVYSSTLTGLQMGTTYFIRAYVVTAAGTAYGNELSFTTLGQFLPNVITSGTSGITSTSVTLSGEVTDEGDTPVIDRGFAVSDSPGPTMQTHHEGAGIGSFSAVATGLQANQTYYARAFARNSAGISYGNEVSFSTTEYVAPVVVTMPVSNIGPFSAQGNGVIQEEGDFPVWNRGICWSLSPGPTTQDNHEETGGGIGGYVLNMNDLQPETTYYVKAYARTAMGTFYGNEVSFITEAFIIPEVITAPATEIGMVSATLGGAVTNIPNVVLNGGGILINGTSVLGSLSGQFTFEMNVPGAFSAHFGMGGDVQIDGFYMVPNTTYHVRAFARYFTNSEQSSYEIAYGNEITFKTDSLHILTSPINEVGAWAALATGAVQNQVDLYLGDRGFCYDTLPNPTWDVSMYGSPWTDLGNNSFSKRIAGLKPATTYYARAWVMGPHNIVGYGNQIEFTTDDQLLNTTAVSSIGLGSAVSGGSVVNAIDLGEGDFGLCWSTAPNPTTINNNSSQGNSPSFSIQLEGLAPKTTYYVRAYGQNWNLNPVLVAYGNEISFTTDSIRLTTSPVINISSNSATCGGTVLNEINADQIMRGVCWSTSPNPTNGNWTVGCGNGGGSFTGQLENLQPNTTYYVRTYGEYFGGGGPFVGYGPQRTFTTNP